MQPSKTVHLFDEHNTLKYYFNNMGVLSLND